VRSTCTILAIWALLLGFIEAPFVHFHQQAAAENHHAGQQAHAHTPHLATPAGASFHRIDPADDVRLVTWFQPIQQSVFILFFAPEQTGVVAPVVNREFLRAEPSICSHGPPLLANIPARAPPIIPA